MLVRHFVSEAGYMKKLFIIFFFLFYCIIFSYGQRMPFFIHHVSNPYLYNPGFAGHEKHAVLFATHRQQWLGIEGAPVSTNLSFHTPAGNTNPISLGADLTHDRIGIFRYTTLRATFGYLVPLGVEKEHFIRFGLSAGLDQQQFDLEGISIDDDLTLQNALENNIFWDGRFGFQYHLENLNIGFALPHFFSNPLESQENMATTDLLNNFLVSANYRINFDPTGNLAFEPTILYNVSRRLENQLEAFGVLHIKDAFWIGGGYQQQAGMAGILGFKIKNLKFSYAYGLSGKEISAYSGATHEAQIGLLMGKKREIMKRKPRLSTSNHGEKIPEAVLKASGKDNRRKEKQEVVPDRKKAPAPVQDTTNNVSQENENIIVIPASNDVQAPRQPAEEKPTNQPMAKEKTNYDSLHFESLDKGKEEVILLKKADDPKVEPAHQQPDTTEVQKAMSQEKLVKIAPSRKLEHPLAIKEGKYIIAGTFSQESNARNLIKQLTDQGYQPNIGFHTEKQFYYVYVMSSADLEVLRQQLPLLKKSPLFENAWILSVEE